MGKIARFSGLLCLYAILMGQLNAAPPPATSRGKRLIFINFYNATGNKDTAYLENSIVDSIHELIKNKYAYDRVSSAELESAARQSGFTRADYYDTEKLQKLGAVLKADGIIFGKLSGDARGILITGKILSVIEKEVIAEKELVAPLNAEMFENVNAISEALAAKIKDLFIPSDWGAVRRSAMLPGWGQFYKQRKKWGYIWGAAVGISFLTASYFTYAYIKNNSAYQSAGPDDDPSGLFKKAESNYSAMNIMWYVTGGLYLLNLIDAYIFQGDYDLEKVKTASLLPENLSIAARSIGLQNQSARTIETMIQITWRSAL